MIPATNLINQKSNDIFYFGKLADEIVRYSRINAFIFNPKNVLTFTTLKYNLREDEIILLQSLLTQEYFHDLIAAPINPYTSSNAYEMTKPITTQNYSNVESFAQFTQPNEELECHKTVKEAIANDYWRKIFPVNAKETIYKSDPRSCSFTAIQMLIKDYIVEDITKNTLKEILVDAYKKMYQKYDQLVLNILKAQGKKLLANQVREKQLIFADMIMSEDYYATNLDIWLLIVHYNLPVVLIAVTNLLENNNKYMTFNSTGSNDYYFLKMSAAVLDKPPIYTLITDVDNSLRINIGKLRSANIQEKLRANPIGNGLERFIATFSLTEANKRRRREPAVVPVAPVTTIEPVASTKTVEAVKKISKKIKLVKA